jgi:hypothetical protein
LTGVAVLAGFQARWCSRLFVLADFRNDAARRHVRRGFAIACIGVGVASALTILMTRGPPLMNPYIMMGFWACCVVPTGIHGAVSAGIAGAWRLYLGKA